MKFLLSALLFLTFNSLIKPVHASCLVSNVSGHGQPLLLMPGFLSDETVWQDVAAEMAKSHQVHQLAIAGFGKNPACDQAEDIFNQALHDVRNYISSNKLNKPVFIGHSLGGLMAFKLALLQDIELSGAISVDGLPFIGPVFTRDSRTQVVDLYHQAESMKNWYQHAHASQIKMLTQQGVAQQTQLKDKYQTLVEMAEQSDPITAGSAIYTVMQTDLRQDLDNLKLPMLLIGAAGGFESKEQQEATRKLYKAQLNHAKQVTLLMNNQGRHFLMWDEPRWLIHTIKQFIKERI
ncbi:alpha/beta fold hydrolase [Pseudoalteromonas 'SMAR']|uniref:alpha/beta fold hydrolase n=1 Tax=Pseudoalteromonas 'SMAR' TaxID=3416908 RepID=UPI003AF2F95D